MQVNYKNRQIEKICTTLLLLPKNTISVLWGLSNNV